MNWKILFITATILETVLQSTYAGGPNSRPIPDNIAETAADEIGSEDDVGSSVGKDSSSPPRRVIRLWPNGVIKYKISPSFSTNSPEFAKLRAIMRDLSQHTCVSFVQASEREKSYISIMPGLKCSSFLGQQEGASTLMLAVHKCFGNGTLARNFMRVLGFTFENNRADRDNFIQINWDNIAESNKKKFNKLSADDYPVTNLPYDFDSVTHYGRNSWAINKSTWTIRAKKDNNLPLGNNKGFSTNDYNKIKSLYHC